MNFQNFYNEPRSDGNSSVEENKEMKTPESDFR